MNRVSCREAVFDDPFNQRLFAHHLADLPARGVHVLTWVLMPNHFHLLVLDDDGTLPNAIGGLTREFVKRVNQRQPWWDGPLFRDRYRSVPIRTDAQLLHVYAYIALNPWSAGLVRRPDDPWPGAHQALAGLTPPPSWLALTRRDAAFGGVAAYRRHVHEVAAGRRGAAPDALRLEGAPGPDGLTDRALALSASGRSSPEIARELGVHRTTVWRRLARRGRQTRPATRGDPD
ncbi:MAG: REP element-mobilizing transposase RayT [Myxococcota bacterium]|jgi:REP element-mobilizing transposase RayT